MSECKPWSWGKFGPEVESPVLRGPCSVLEDSGLTPGFGPWLQLLANADMEHSNDGSGNWASATMWETQIESVTPGFAPSHCGQLRSESADGNKLSLSNKCFLKKFHCSFKKIFFNSGDFIYLTMFPLRKHTCFQYYLTNYWPCDFAQIIVISPPSSTWTCKKNNLN